MSEPLYLSACAFETLSDRVDVKQPRARYVEYQEDLYKIANGAFDHRTLTSGGQYSYTELADHLFETAGVNNLAEQTDLMVLSYWTPEFDPDYSALGPYLHHKLQLNCTSFDVCDCGSLAPIVALSVIKDYLAGHPAILQALLVGLEQNTIPLPAPQMVPVPGISSGGYCTLSRQRTSDSDLCLNDVTILSEGQLLNGTFNPLDWLEAHCNRLDIDPQHCQLWVRKDSAFYRKLRFYQLNHPGRLEALNCAFLRCNYSAMNFFRWAKEHSQSGDAITDHLFIEEDLESLEIGLVHITSGGHHE